MQEEVARLAGGGEGVCGDGLEWGGRKREEEGGETEKNGGGGKSKKGRQTGALDDVGERLRTLHNHPLVRQERLRPRNLRRHLAKLNQRKRPYATPHPVISSQL